jgi:hypothetical protein
MVFSVLQNHESLTFQMVADSVVRTLGYSQMESNNERTLRRRVYDVLNVFVAAGITAKDGKAIVWRRTRMPTPPDPESDCLAETIRTRRTQLIDKIAVFVNWKLVIQRNRTRERPAVFVPVWRTLFVGFPNVPGSSYEQAVDKKTVEIRCAATPVFFSPLEAIGKMGFTTEQKLAVLRENPQLEKAIPYAFPEMAEPEENDEEG